MDGIKDMVGRKVYIETSSNRRYVGTIISADTDLKFIQILDKYDDKVWIAFNEIKVLQEEKQQ